MTMKHMSSRHTPNSKISFQKQYVLFKHTLFEITHEKLQSIFKELQPVRNRA